MKKDCQQRLDNESTGCYTHNLLQNISIKLIVNIIYLSLFFTNCVLSQKYLYDIGKCAFSFYVRDLTSISLQSLVLDWPLIAYYYVKKNISVAILNWFNYVCEYLVLIQWISALIRVIEKNDYSCLSHTSSDADLCFFSFVIFFLFTVNSFNLYSLIIII